MREHRGSSEIDAIHQQPLQTSKSRLRFHLFGFRSHKFITTDVKLLRLSGNKWDQNADADGEGAQQRSQSAEIQLVAVPIRTCLLVNITAKKTKTF